ncbi:MAG TPA: hypothetical protein EYH01_04335 [Campylobacterales bacterium]|nr:hypothetical protein [Campylobacterales bacterium]
MLQAKVTLTQELIHFIDIHKELGFKDKSSMVRDALGRMKRAYEEEKLKKSAQLYAELYEEDCEAKEWLDDVEDWVKDV